MDVRKVESKWSLKWSRRSIIRDDRSFPQKKSTSMHSLSAEMVSRIEFDEKEQECMAKDEQIQVNISKENLRSIVKIFLGRFYKRRFVV